MHPADRPICPYEQTEYNTAVTDALQHIGTSRINAYGRHVVHMVALAQVMVTRAGLALREAEFTKPLVITGEKYHMTTPKIAPALTAYEKLERAWRRLLIGFERNFGTSWPEYCDDPPYEARIKIDTALDPEAQATHYDTMPPPDDHPDEATPQSVVTPGTHHPHPASPIEGEGSKSDDFPQRAQSRPNDTTSHSPLPSWERGMGGGA